MKIVRHDPRTAQAQATARELRALVGKLKRQLREKVGIEGLTLSQVTVLIHLERQGSATVSELARTENVRPQSMGATVAGLQALALLEGTADPGDGRRTLLSLTKLAHEKIRAIRTAREDWLFHAIRERFNANEQDALARGVELLKRLAEG
ncbi:MarR family transcriptional regulator [Rhodanobacter sp. 7MK24]|uniref:MarR family winged helix-turn-helix transcriptional regulator n=1 Tax=Rhodanobacter sp. 7MK24 TaxID=2775922 RepID=UPI00177FBDEA|nr:MarR family transcriptional regulator [Rhodanobacter sp. 7MK24]MBD8882089.1 MarR family transcriptional regulator [Rhodanobacter sp. 7MK24]